MYRNKTWTTENISFHEEIYFRQTLLPVQNQTVLRFQGRNPKDPKGLGDEARVEKLGCQVRTFCKCQWLLQTDMSEVHSFRIGWYPATSQFGLALLLPVISKASCLWWTVCNGPRTFGSGFFEGGALEWLEHRSVQLGPRKVEPTKQYFG